jgi:hypothetical protein
MTFPRELWLETINAPKKCGFCGAVMILAWDGQTPSGNYLSAYICPECFSTRYLCSNKTDPMFLILAQIQEAFMQVYLNSGIKSAQEGKKKHV